MLKLIIIKLIVIYSFEFISRLFLPYIPQTGFAANWVEVLAPAEQKTSTQWLNYINQLIEMSNDHSEHPSGPTTRSISRKINYYSNDLEDV